MTAKLTDARIAELLRSPWDPDCLPAQLLATIESDRGRIAELEKERDEAVVMQAKRFSEVLRLTASSERLREALKPFADYAGSLHRTTPDHTPISPGSSMARKQIVAGDLRAAASALAATTEGR